MGLDGYERYAVYWAPAPGSALAEAGADWLGWDPAACQPRPQSEAQAALTEAPRRYGFHATLKPPFRLNRGTHPADLDAALAALAAEIAPVAAPPLALDAALGFAALRPSGPCPELDALAAACVTRLDPLRAPLSEAELEKRRAGRLEPREEAHLRRWGYPYVLDAFRFHLTLSGRLHPEAAPAVLARAAAAFGPAIAGPLAIDALCLFGDPGAGAAFHLVARHRLAG
ncbi:DUF1045 domain-containing protein [Paralimibaculum aggregatum]|uniref:DUF1045 domain-containing protein n=1 Tax=Paralimibaculum aggregatum TaxID=3036245 RepID=A0ABQ6LJC2_9RHOB|nr:DUF1045 domain-containing protein [Limibaculum sp. NKW23]GMG83372.1 DUF1045 domain-containing protein [Limibaculum sp. NKW23]